jgi:hypothetical protein
MAEGYITMRREDYNALSTLQQAALHAFIAEGSAIDEDHPITQGLQVNAMGVEQWVCHVNHARFIDIHPPYVYHLTITESGDIDLGTGNATITAIETVQHNTHKVTV